MHRIGCRLPPLPLLCLLFFFLHWEYCFLFCYPSFLSLFSLYLFSFFLPVPFWSSPHVSCNWGISGLLPQLLYQDICLYILWNTTWWVYRELDWEYWPHQSLFSDSFLYNPIFLLYLLYETIRSKNKTIESRNDWGIRKQAKDYQWPNVFSNINRWRREHGTII